MAESDYSRNFGSQIAKDFISKIYDLKIVINQDLIGCDCKWTLFVSAARSYRYFSLIKPFPPKYCSAGDEINKSNIEALLNVIDQVQSFDIILQIIEDGNFDELDTEVVELLHWVLVAPRYPVFRTANKIEITKLLSKLPPTKDKFIPPANIFFLDLDPNFEKIFENHRNDGYESKYAFHGSKLDSFHSITKHGLHQHVCKNGIFGEGIYLSSELSVSLFFSKRCAAWGHSKSGSFASCVAICEYIENPKYVKFLSKDDKKIPESYVLITNNDLVRVRALLYYGEVTKTATSLALTWIYRHKYILSVICYTVFLALIGFTNNGSLYYFINLLKKKSFQILKTMKDLILPKF